MKTWIIEILGIACGVSIMMSQFRWYAWFVEKTNNLKPFSCELCMAFWTYLIYSMSMHTFTVESVLNAFICSYVAYLTSTKFLKW